MVVFQWLLISIEIHIPSNLYVTKCYYGFYFYFLQLWKPFLAAVSHTETGSEWELALLWGCRPPSSSSSPAIVSNRCCYCPVSEFHSVSGILTATYFHSAVWVIIREYLTALIMLRTFMFNKIQRKMFQVSLWEYIWGFIITYWFTWTLLVKKQPIRWTDWKMPFWGWSAS